MPAGLHVLVTNNTLAARAGTELFVRDLTLGLLRRGHRPVAYSPMLGEVAAELREAAVPVIGDLSALGRPPDVIHGQHHATAMTAMLRWPDVPALFMCHGLVPWEEEPPRFPSIRRYVAVDDACVDRVVASAGVPQDEVRTIYNAVDLARFRRRPPLPARPRTALVFSNSASEATFLGPIREACLARGFERVDVAGHASAHPTATPESILPACDVVFAKARAALEAMAVGCAVVVADAAGFGGLVTPDTVETMRRLNFGVRTMQGTAVTADRVGAALDAYDAGAAGRVSDWIRAHADFEHALDQVLATYEEVLASTPEPDGQNEAASDYVAWLGRFFHDTAHQRASGLEQTLQLESLTRALEAELAALRAGHDELRRQHEAVLQSNTWRLESQARALEAELAVLRAGHDELRRQHEAVLHSNTWRSFAWYRRLRGGR